MNYWIRETNTHPYELIERIVGGIIPIILIVCGTIANGLCIIHLSRRLHRRSQSTNAYLISLFIMDTLSLYQWNLNNISIASQSGQALADRSFFFCRSIVFLTFYTIHMSTLLLCLASLDRTFIVWMHRYRLIMARRRYAWIAIFLAVIFVFGLDGFLLSIGTIDTKTEKMICYNFSDDNLMNFYDKIYRWIDLIPLYLIPVMIMILAMILIALKLHLRRVHSRHLSRKQRTSWMLVRMCIVFIILTLPNRLCHKIFFSKIINHVYSDTLLLITDALFYLRPATNMVLLYSSNHTFRKQVATLCCFHLCQRLCRTRNRVLPIHNTQIVQISHYIPTRSR